GRRTSKALSAEETARLHRYLDGLEAGNLSVSPRTHPETGRPLGGYALMHVTCCVALLPTRAEAVELAEGRVPAPEVAAGWLRRSTPSRYPADADASAGGPTPTATSSRSPARPSSSRRGSAASSTCTGSTSAPSAWRHSKTGRSD